MLNRIRPEFGSSIAVFGCGTVGMSAIMAAKIAGCKNIIAVGGNPKSLELAKELGATHTINRREESDIVGKIKNEIVPGGVNYAIDTSGVADFVKKALASCRFMGTAVVLGATGDVTFNIQAELMGDAKSLIGITEGDAIPKLFIPELLDYYKKGMFPFDKLIKFYPFEKINEAFEESGSGKCIKAVYHKKAMHKIASLLRPLCQLACRQSLVALSNGLVHQQAFCHTCKLCVYQIEFGFRMFFFDLFEQHFCCGIRSRKLA